ncbi:MAG: hypothetical protein ABJB12_21715 [Pseudomonadota bacterium]
MDFKLLTDSIIRQTTVLIAQLSTTAGIRAPLAHLADEVFLTLSEELESQGLSRKVVADMFGMALRSYQRRVQRLRESATVPGKTLWESVHEHLQLKGRATRRALLDRFPDDDPEAIGAVLNDLTQSGLVSRAGNGASTLFAVTADDDRKTLAREGKLETAAALVWLELCRDRDAQPSELAARLGLDQEIVSLSLSSLRDQGRISVDSEGRQSAIAMVIPVGAEAGWEAAVFDHFQAVANALTTKLRRGRTRSAKTDTTGGATLTFEICDDHPLAPRVLDLLHRTRSDLDELWAEVETHNGRAPIPEDRLRRVTFYFGQFVRGTEDES